jgi:hypothetical protein
LPDVAEFRQKFLDSGIDEFRPVPESGLSESGDGRMFERESQLRHLKEDRLRLPSEENGLRF